MKDMLLSQCEECMIGVFIESSLMDDIAGHLHCNKCGRQVSRYQYDDSAMVEMWKATGYLDGMKSSTVKPEIKSLFESHNTQTIVDTKHEWHWGNFDYNRGYNDGIHKADTVLRHKDEEIAGLKRKLKEFITEDK